MNSLAFNLSAPWDVVRERMKENNVDLTDADLDYKKGEEDQLLERLQRKIKSSKNEIKMLIESISSNSETAG